MIRLLSELWRRLLRFGFRLLYHELAFTYDVVSQIVSLGSWRCWQRTAFTHLPDSESGWILELAHGTGNLQIDLKQAGYQTMGYDLSSQMGRIAQKKLRRTEWDAFLVRGRAEQLPFADRQFAAVVSTFPTEFIVADETLKEVYRVLEASGVFVVVMSSEFVSGGILRIVLEWVYRIIGQRQGQNSNMRNDILAVLHTHGFDAEFVQEPCPRSTVYLIVSRKRTRIRKTFVL